MKTGLKRTICTALAILVAAGALPAAVPSSRAEGDVVVRGTYEFSMTNMDNLQGTDEFVFDEQYFLASSAEDCLPLAVLSAQVALASGSRFGMEADPLEKDTSLDSYNLVSMLEAMGFEDVETNAYFALEKKADSCGCAVARRTLTGPDGPRTLLAVFPRSTGYKQEWVGDMTVGTDGMHEGFKKARDEILRFVKQYVGSHGITGSVKIWTTGHSRGAAVANLLGGFFAGGGDAYFDGAIRVAPEDVYCRTTATPRGLKSGITKAEELSVSGARGGEYADDTPGDPFAYTGGGVCEPDGPAYAGIRCYDAWLDLIPDVPPVTWGYTRYGTECLLETLGVGTEEMLAELYPLNPSVYPVLLNGLLPDGYARWTFDATAMEIVPDGMMSPEEADAFLAERMLGILRCVPSPEAYVEGGYQEALKALGGIYGMLRYLLIRNADGIKTKLMKPLLYCLLAYASERLKAEGRAESEGEAAAVALCELLSFASGVPLDPETCTVDRFASTLALFVADRADTPAVHDAVYSAAENFPPEGAMLMRMLFAGFQKQYDYANPPADGALLMDFIRACAYGPDPGARSAGSYKDAAAVRRSLYNLMDLILKSTAPDAGKAIGKSGNTFDGSGSFKGFVSALMPALLTKKEDGRIVKVYTGLADAADGYLAEGIRDAFADVLADTEKEYDRTYTDDARGHVLTLAEYAPAFRHLVFCVLEGTARSPYATEDAIRDACTFLRFARIALSKHYTEACLAYLRAAVKNAAGE